MEDKVTDTIVSILSVEGPRRATVFATLIQILGNIVKEPENVKFRKLRVTNSTVQRRVLNEPLVLEFLQHVGFAFRQEHLVLFAQDAGATREASKSQQQETAPQEQWGPPQLFIEGIDHAIFLLKEAKKVAAAYPANSGPGAYDDFGDTEEPIEGEDSQTSLLAMRTVLQQLHDPSMDGPLQAADTLSDFDIVNARGDGASGAITRAHSEDDESVEQLLLQRHAVASAYTAYQAQRRGPPQTAEVAPAATLDGSTNSKAIDTTVAERRTPPEASHGAAEDIDWDLCDLYVWVMRPDLQRVCDLHLTRRADHVGAWKTSASGLFCHVVICIASHASAAGSKQVQRMLPIAAPCFSALRCYQCFMIHILLLTLLGRCPNCRLVCTLDDIQLLRCVAAHSFMSKALHPVSMVTTIPAGN